MKYIGKAGQSDVVLFNEAEKRNELYVRNDNAVKGFDIGGLRYEFLRVANRFDMAFATAKTIS